LIDLLAVLPFANIPVVLTLPLPAGRG